MEIIDYQEREYGEIRYELVINIKPGFIKFLIQNPDGFSDEKNKIPECRIINLPNCTNAINIEPPVAQLLITGLEFPVTFSHGINTHIFRSHCLVKWLELSYRASAIYNNFIQQCKLNNPGGIPQLKTTPGSESGMSRLLRDKIPSGTNKSVSGLRDANKSVSGLRDANKSVSGLRDPEFRIIANKSRDTFFMSKKFYEYLCNVAPMMVKSGEYEEDNIKYDLEWKISDDVAHLTVDDPEHIAMNNAVYDYLKSVMVVYRKSFKYEYF